MYQYILGMYWYEHFRTVSSRASGFQMFSTQLFCFKLQVYHLLVTLAVTVYLPNVRIGTIWQYSCTLGFKLHFKLVVFLGIRTGPDVMKTVISLIPYIQVYIYHAACLV
jgi:hypothetical protein